MSDTKKRMIIWMMVLLLAVSVIVSVVNAMKYNNQKKEIEKLKAEKAELEYRVDELEYYLSSPINDSYIEKIAREKLGLSFPDETIYHTDIME